MSSVQQKSAGAVVDEWHRVSGGAAIVELARRISMHVGILDSDGVIEAGRWVLIGTLEEADTRSDPIEDITSFLNLGVGAIL